MKPNQGMRQPQLGGIGSRFDVRQCRPLCKHRPEDQWRVKGVVGVWTCAICHPPIAFAADRVEWFGFVDAPGDAA